MTRIQPLNLDSVQGPAKQMLDAVKAKLGVVPNMMRTMAHAPSVLESYLNFSGALAKSSLDGKTREAMALAVGQANKCQYCVSAHTLLGKKAGLDEAAVAAARAGEASDPKLAALLRLAMAINNKQGNVTDADVTAARSAGVTDQEVLETVAVVSLNMFTNFFNHVADPQIDFPVVEL
ncbi:MAG TPA: carboxymuconolactone decarboxylase family protein [Tepidisphaeraceae bacterium]|nr:carboxymuconolactone decarboxylase family protein [Tepidisphaeraceae bacterium]